MSNHTKSAVVVNGERTEMPRPLRKLPGLADPSVVKDLRAAAKKHLGMTDRAAGAMSTMWVHPEHVLPQIQEPRQMRVPGGTLLYVEGQAWTPRLLPDPGNPRNAAGYTYRLADAGSQLSDHAIPVHVEARTAELVATASSREALANAAEVAMAKTRASNSPYPPISEQGIMDSPFGVMTEVSFSNGDPSVVVPFVREGSTRVSHAHEVCRLDVEDPLYRMPSASRHLRDFIDGINALVTKPAAALTDAERGEVRCATSPFMLIVGIQEDVPGTLDLASAIKVKVAQEHLNTKMDWSVAAQNSVMADDCLASAFDAGGIIADIDELEWLLGQRTRTEAAASGYGQHADDRFTRVVWLFTTDTQQVHDAIRRPIAFVLAKQPGRKHVAVKKTTKIPLAAELTAREFRGAPGFPETGVDRITKVIINGADLAGRVVWKATDRSLNALAKAAAREVETGSSPGPAGVELAMRALYYAAVHDTFRVPRNDRGPNSDRRSVADLLENMLMSKVGVGQLADIVKAGRRGQAAVLRDDSGEPVPAGDGEPVVLTNDTLRYTLFPKAGSRAGGDGEDPFLTAQREVAELLKDFRRAVKGLELVSDDDGAAIVAHQGLAPAMVKEWRRILDEARDKFDDWYELGVEHASQAQERQASALGVASAETDTSEDTDEAGAA